MSESKFDFIESDAGKIYEGIIRKVEEKVAEPLYGGDERRIFADALAAVVVQVFATVNDAARQKMLRYARGTVLDALAERVAAERLKPDTAKTILRFSLPSTLPTGAIIPAGTRATPDGKMFFATDYTETIPAGSLYVNIPATATIGGAALNDLPVGSIKTIVDLIPMVGDVSNIIHTAGGNDGEPYDTEGDDRFRERIKLAANRISTAGPIKAYRYWVMTADSSIIDAAITSPTPGVVQITPLLAGGAVADVTLKAKILKACNEDSVRPLTDLVIVENPTEVLYDIILHYTTDTRNSEDVIQNTEGQGGAIERFIGQQSIELGRDINPDELRRQILAPIWAKNPIGPITLQIIEPQYIAVGETQVAKHSGVLTVTHEVLP